MFVSERARWLHLGFLFVSLVVAIPRMAFPFNSQVPPIARIGEPYSFTFSSTSFSSDAANLDYSLQNAPAWLNIDARSRTLYGTPGSADAGFPAFSIVAFDNLGRVAMPATLVVVAPDHLAPVMDAEVSDVLAQGGTLSTPQSLLVLSKVSFAFSFPHKTFKTTGGALTFYATLTDHTPLPSWLSFDAANLRFSGTAPLLSASPQYFDILLIATNVPGFAAAWVPFTIVVSVHSFYFNEVETSTATEDGQSFKILNIRDHLTLDGQPVKSNDISKAVAQKPTWLTFNERTLDLEGNPPADFSSGEVSIQVWNRFGDIANKTIFLQVSNGLLSFDLPKIEAKAGEDFEYVLADSLFTQDGLQVSMDLGSAATWLRFDPATQTIRGKVPADINSPVEVEITAKTADGSKSDTRQFRIEVEALSSATNISISPDHSSSTSSAAGGVFAATGTPESTNRGRTVGLVIGVVIAILGVIFFLLFLVWYRRFDGKDKEVARSQMKETISRPTYNDSDPWSAGMDDDLEKGSDELRRSGDRPPQVQLKLPEISPFKKSRRSQVPRMPTIMPVPPTPVVPQSMIRKSHLRGQSLASSTINNDDARILDNINRSSWGYSGTTRPHDSMKLPAEIARRSRRSDLAALTTLENNKRVSRYASSTRLSLGHAGDMDGSTLTNTHVVDVDDGRSTGTHNNLAKLLRIQDQNQSPSYADSVTTHSTSVLFSPMTPAPPPRISQPASHLCARCSMSTDLEQHNSRVLSYQRPITRRAPHRSAFFSARAHSRGSSSSRHRGAILGLSTIHASPDLEADTSAGVSQVADGLGITASAAFQQYPVASVKESDHPLRRNPTRTSENTATTGKTFDSETDFSQDLSQPPPIPPRHPAHKRWSSQLKARLSRPISGIPSEASRFADIDDEPPPTMYGANVPVLDDDASIYSQSSRSVSVFHSATPSPERERPVTRGKIPVGGVRVPPFTDPVHNDVGLIMNRPHPRVSIRKASLQRQSPPQKRTPLGRVQGAENRLSGGALGIDKITLRPAQLKSGKGKRPVSVNEGFEEKIRSVKGSVMSGRTESSKGTRATSLSPISRGNECFL
jgi:axial budding pattern protein 2